MITFRIVDEYFHITTQNEYKNIRKEYYLNVLYASPAAQLLT